MATADQATLLRGLAGDDCPREDCSGTLERETYKSDDAVVCETCDTPFVRIW